jgi:transcriptional regulator with XRE-family HTH domain
MVERLRELKQKRRVTAKEIAKASGVSPQTVYGWLAGKVPRSKHLASVASFLGVTTDYLVHGDQAGPRSELIQELRACVPQLTTSQLIVLLMMARELARKN